MISLVGENSEWEDIDMGDGFGNIGADPMFVAFRITGRRVEQDGVRYRFRRLEDTIHPFSLSWPVPLIDDAVNKVDFQRHWEKLNYVFDLPDPGRFSQISSTSAERILVERFVTTCRRLASYSVFNDNGGEFSIRMEDGEGTVRADLPSDEVFSGLSATFRQLHNDGEEASYKKVHSIIGKGINNSPSADVVSARKILKAWDSARKRLNGSMLETLVCEKVLGDADRHGQKITMEGVQPGPLIKTFNYGDSLHWGSEKENLAELTDDPTNEKFYQFCVTDAMITLSHFYFGFSVLASTALRN